MGFGKSVEGKSCSGCQCRQGFLEEEVFVRMQALGRGAVGDKIGPQGRLQDPAQELGFVL